MPPCTTPHHRRYTATYSGQNRSIRDRFGFSRMVEFVSLATNSMLDLHGQGGAQLEPGEDQQLALRDKHTLPGTRHRVIADTVPKNQRGTSAAGEQPDTSI